ncbi:hypothetical protein AVEN_260858-1, partial [Araneus ventricosus]
MLSEGAILLLPHNTHTAREIQESLRKFQWEVWSHQIRITRTQIRHPIWVANTFFSESDAKTASENWFHEQDVISAKPE